MTDTKKDAQIKDVLQRLQNQTNCLLTITKWQRKFGPPQTWASSTPPKGSEVFVGKLPRDLFEDELIPVLLKAGNLYEVRLMMDPSGHNRGFAYVKYTSKAEAEKAIAMLNNFEIRKSQFLGVMKSVDNNRLFVGGISKTKKQEDLLEEMKRYTEDVLDVILYSDINDKSKNRGFAFVEYRDHAAAYSARQKLLKNPPILWGTDSIKIDWAEPEREVDESTMNKVRILYVRNLSLTTTDQQLRDLFSSFGGEIERVKKIKDYAFIHFATREQAEEAKAKLQGCTLDKCEIDINWSKPVTNREEYQQRKAASKALSCGAGIANSMPTAFGLNGEPIIVNQRVRTAAGAQGYNASRPYPIRQKHNESTLSSLQTPILYSNIAFIQEMAMRNSVDPFSLQPTLQHPIYAADGANLLDEYITSQQDVQYHISPQPQLLHRYPNMLSTSPYSVVSQSALGNCWGGQTFIQPTSPTPTFLSASPYVLSAPTIASVPGAYASHPFYSSQMVSQISSVSGSNMSIDRT